jgi:hypothetical protein
MSNANNTNTNTNTNTNEANNANTNEATKTGFFAGFNWKQNTLSAVLVGAATAAGMYFLGSKCECDMTDAE